MVAASTVSRSAALSRALCPPLVSSISTTLATRT